MTQKDGDEMHRAAVSMIQCWWWRPWYPIPTDHINDCVLPIAVVVKFIVAGKSDKHTKTSPERVEYLCGSFNPNLQHTKDHSTYRRQDIRHIDNTANNTIHSKLIRRLQLVPRIIHNVIRVCYNVIRCK